MATPDKNLLSFASRRPLGVQFVGDLEAIPPGTSDTLKITDCSDGEVRARKVFGGREDCVDVNNKCSNIFILAELFVPKGKYLATIKGGSSNITLQGDVSGHGSEVDIDIGNVSDQSDNLTGPVKLCLRHIAGDSITVRCLGGARPLILNPDVQQYKIVFEVPGFWKSWFLKGYKLLKKLGLPV